jgi:hypothetical protein
MIDVSRQLAPAPKRAERHLRRTAHAPTLKQIYDRGGELMPADYLARNQDEPERGFKIRAQAVQRQAIRNAKRLANLR